MVGDSAVCGHKGCEEVFIKKTTNQKYHDENCRSLATNANLMEKYYLRKAIREGVKRTCSQCDTILSSYNENNICAGCDAIKKHASARAFSELLPSLLIAA